MRKTGACAVLFLLMANILWAAETSSGPVKSFQIRNCKYSELLRPKDAKGATGTQIVLYPAEPWKCMTWRLFPAGESQFRLQNHFTSKTFEGRTNQTEVAVLQIPFGKDGSKAPVWRFTKLPNGNYQITDVVNGLALTAVSSETSGVHVIEAAWETKMEQQWDLIETDPSKLTM